jgi:hypothetical protein
MDRCRISGQCDGFQVTLREVCMYFGLNTEDRCPADLLMAQPNAPVSKTGPAMC